jgi:hypothetical protein
MRWDESFFAKLPTVKEGLLAIINAEPYRLNGNRVFS